MSVTVPLAHDGPVPSIPREDRVRVPSALDSHQHGQALWGELRAIIEDAISGDPRTLQTAIGPSGIAVPCDRCLIQMLAGNKPDENPPPWLPALGRAVHTWLQQVFTLHWVNDPRHATMPADQVPRRFLTETRVNAGDLPDGPLEGNADLFDTFTGTVIDWKLVGKTTLDKVRRTGAPSVTYQGQGQTYGYGMARAGFPVRHVMVVYLPRNTMTLNGAQVWCAPYDPLQAERAMARAAQFQEWIRALGADTVLAAAAPHTGDEFSCHKFPGETPPKAPGRAPARAGGPNATFAL